MNIEVNAVAVILAAISSMVVGYIWYGSDKFGFGKKWAKLSGVDLKKASSTVAIASALFSSFVMAYGLAYATFIFHGYFHNTSFYMAALAVGLFVSVFFQVLRMYQRDQFNQRLHAETAIHISNEFVTVMIMAFIIGLLGV